MECTASYLHCEQLSIYTCTTCDLLNNYYRTFAYYIVLGFEALIIIRLQYYTYYFFFSIIFVMEFCRPPFENALIFYVSFLRNIYIYVFLIIFRIGVLSAAHNQNHRAGTIYNVYGHRFHQDPGFGEVNKLYLVGRSRKNNRKTLRDVAAVICTIWILVGDKGHPVICIIFIPSARNRINRNIFSYLFLYNIYYIFMPICSIISFILKLWDGRDTICTYIHKPTI